MIGVVSLRSDVTPAEKAFPDDCYWHAFLYIRKGRQGSVSFSVT